MKDVFWRLSFWLRWGWPSTLPPLSWWRRYRAKRFTTFIFPVIRNLKFSDMPTAKECMSVQPMDAPINPSLYFIMMNKATPRLGEVFTAGPKHANVDRCGCCIRGDDYWHQIWTRNGWVYEQNLTSEEFKFLVDYYKDDLKAQYEKERTTLE